ncbi:MAG: YbjN domain-containing protein [Chitinophagales bacterium]
MSDGTQYFAIVEDCIKKLGIDPATTKGQKDGQWNLTKGSVKVYIDIMYIEREKRHYFQVLTPVMQLPSSNTDNLTLELLQINHQLYGAAFTVYNRHVCVKAIRECDGLDVNEAFAAITRVGNYGDHYDDILKKKYPNNRPIGFRAG